MCIFIYFYLLCHIEIVDALLIRNNLRILLCLLFPLSSVAYSPGNVSLSLEGVDLLSFSGIV
jgi:hypothetical protein